MDQYPGQMPPHDSPQPGFPPPGYPEQPAYVPQSEYPQQPGYQQPGYPEQPGAYPPGTPFPGQSGYYPPQTQPKKGRAGLWITLLVIVVLLGVVGGVGYFVVFPKIQQISPNGTLQTFCDGYKNLNAQEVYGTFSSSLQAKPGDSEQELASAFDLVKAMGATVDSCSISNVQQNGSTATATITITATALGKPDTASQQVSLVLENGAWKINDIGDSGSSI